MKTETLIRLGGLATMIHALGAALLSLSFFLLGETSLTTLRVWLVFMVEILLIFGVYALYAVQAKRSGVLGLIGFILIIVGLLFGFAEEAQEMVFTTGIMNQEQVIQAQQVPSIATIGLLNSVMWIMGAIVFGYATFRTGTLPLGAGILLMLVGVTTIFTGLGVIFQYLFVVISLTAWCWLGWALWTKPSIAG